MPDFCFFGQLQELSLYFVFLLINNNRTEKTSLGVWEFLTLSQTLQIGKT